MELFSRNEAKAYLVGVYMGDGCLAFQSSKSNLRTQFILVGVDLDLHNKTRLCIERVFPETRGRIRICHERDTVAGGPYYRMSINDQSFANFLLRVTGEKKNYFPEEQWLYKPSILREFVAGLMDTDGYIEHSSIKRNGLPRWMIGFGSTSPWLKNFRDTLVRNGVKVSGFHKIAQIPNMPTQNPENWNTPYRINMNIQTFVDAHFYFCASRKCCRVQLWNWWTSRSLGSGAHMRDASMQRQQQLLLEEFAQEKTRVGEEHEQQMVALYANLMESAILYRRVKNPQRPEVSPHSSKHTMGDVRVQLRGKPGRRTVSDIQT